MARSLGVEPVVVRVAAVVLAMVTDGSALLVYLLAWVLIRQEEAGPAAASDTATPREVLSSEPPADESTASPGAGGARAAWSAAGKELRTLAGELRPAPEASTVR